MKTIWKTALLLLLPTLAWSQKVEINRVRPLEVEGAGFSLSQDATVSIEGNAAIFADEWRNLIFYGWIIDSETREVVWHWLDEDEAKEQYRNRDRNRQGIYDRNVEVALKKGNYELYYSGGAVNTGNWNGSGVSVNNFGDLMDVIFDSRRRDRYRERYLDDLYISVTSPSLKAMDLNRLINAKLEGAVVTFNQVRDNDDLEKGFTLTAETSLRLYAVGEGEKRENYDHAWIYNAANRERVFEMSFRNTEFAGGADKNMKTMETITLPAGSYVLSYVSDDSHSYGDWNALPPDDPEFWGVTLWPASAADEANITDFVQPKTATPLVDLTKIRDDEFVSEGIRLSTDLELRVLCLGEEGNSDRMVDYGWIVNANTREKVWEMDSWEAEHAGGANKNRKQEETIKLEAGEYIVYYVSDDSHAYRSWNSAQPYEDDLWGISLWAINENDLDKVTRFNPEDFKNEQVIAEITMVGNDKYLRESFELSEDTKVTVVGLGEGDDGEMYDFGYIKNIETGKIVFEMRYRNSDYGGGARKNREFNETLTLEKGRYRLVWESDGSHSYRRWNADPPHQPELWGITVLKN